MNRPIRVLVVDDSVFMHHTLTKNLEADSGITVMGKARDGLDLAELILCWLKSASVLEPVKMELERYGRDRTYELVNQCLIDQSPKIAGYRVRAAGQIL